MASKGTCMATSDTNLPVSQPHGGLLGIMEQIRNTKCVFKKTELVKSVVATVRNTDLALMHASLQTKLLSPLFKEVTQLAIPAEFEDRGHFIFERADFITLVDRTETALSFLHAIFDVCCHCGASGTKPVDDCLPLLVVVLSANIRHSLWSKDSVQKLTLLIINQLRILYKVDSLSELLQLTVNSNIPSAKHSLLGQYLQVVHQRLQKDKWQSNPTFVESFYWMLTQMIKFPHLSEHLESVLPPMLMFVDSHVTEHKVMGIQCLQHIANNATSEELRWYGRADVLYSVLKQQLYSREPEIARVLHPALLTILPIIDKDPANPVSPTQSKQIDAVFSILISSALTENGIVLRRLYTQHIADYVESLGLSVVRHLSRLVALVSDYLEVYDGPEEVSRFNTLRLLSTVLRVAWPRMHHHSDAILKSLLKLIQDVCHDRTTTPDAVKQKLKDEAVACLSLLKQLCPDVELCLQTIVGSEKLTDVEKVVENLVKT